MSYLFTSESVSEGHPDKIADQISDAILDQFLAFDKSSKVACETLVTTGQVILSGEVKSNIYVDVQSITRKIINGIGYNKSEYMFDGNSCGILSSIHGQSPDISRGVDNEDLLNQGAGDQGMMFGYATNETPDYIPLSLYLSHKILKTLSDIRKEGEIMTYLRPDSKSQVTIKYNDDNKPIEITDIVISTQHDPFNDDKSMLKIITNDIKNILIPQLINDLPESISKLFTNKIKYYINPTGKFVIGGPHGDTGLTGRKIIVDTYGGKGSHGGGAFSGKDPSKVDRSAAYATRHIAKNLVACGVCNEVSVQISYAIGVSNPTSIYINTFGTNKFGYTDSQISKIVEKIFDMRPGVIIQRLKLLNPIYSDTATYGHMGRKNEIVTKIFKNSDNKTIYKEVELFTWEKLDYVEILKKEFNI